MKTTFARCSGTYYVRCIAFNSDGESKEIVSNPVTTTFEEARMEATAAIVDHSSARALALSQAACRASMKAMADTEIGAGLGKAPLENSVVDAIQEAAAAVGSEVEVADSEITIGFQVAVADQAGHSPSLAWKSEKKWHFHRQKSKKCIYQQV